MFIIRDMQSGQLVGSQFGGGRFQWHGVASFCETAAVPGLQLKSEDGNGLLQQVYQIVDLVEGSGEIAAYGEPEYDGPTDRVTRVVTLSPAPPQLDTSNRAQARQAFEDGDMSLAVDFLTRD